MSEVNYKIVQIMPPNGWAAVFSDGDPAQDRLVPLIAWALATNDIDENETEVIGVIVDEDCQSQLVLGLGDFVRYVPPRLG